MATALHVVKIQNVTVKYMHKIGVNISYNKGKRDLLEIYAAARGVGRKILIVYK